MNRAEKMHAALCDGQPHSREEIQQRVGFFLTNNAASELRAQGYNVARWNRGRQVFYQLRPALDEPDMAAIGKRQWMSGSSSASETDGAKQDSPVTLLPAESAGALPLFACDVDESAGLRGAYWDDAA